MNTIMNRTISAIAFGAILVFGVAVQAQNINQQVSSTVTEKVAQQKGYLIANYTIIDQKIFQQYMEAAGPLATKFNATLIIYDVKSKTLEGKAKSVMAVAEFPSIEEAKRFYNSPEYTAARKLRILSTEGSVVLAEGLLPKNGQQ